MKKQLTRRQHLIPRFYLAQWDNSNHEVVQHDLADDTIVHKSAKGILCLGLPDELELLRYD